MKLKDLILLSESKDSKINELHLQDNLSIVKDFIMNTMCNISQFHIYHLMCKNGTHHEALKVFYTELQDELDELAETVIAHYNIQDLEIEDNSYICELYLGYDFNKMSEEVNDLRQDCVNTIKLVDSAENKSVIDKLIDIQEICDKLKYQLQLN